jgi:NAD(P)-dependent dehydrogenase (short-subunit alcohol dehydrogenase family)
MSPATQPVALVTGANRGIGLEIARQLHARGMRVFASARLEADATSTAERLGAEPLVLDVIRRDHIAALPTHFRDGLDVLVNNAGIALDGFDAEVARSTLDVNFYGAQNVTDRLLPSLRPGARVVMISSGLGELSHVSPALRARLLDPHLSRQALVDMMESFVRDVASGIHGHAGWPSSAYSVSKVGLNTLTRILARELAGDPRKIQVNAACPGWVRTRMGGKGAPRSVEQGAKTAVSLATRQADGPTGGFFRDEHLAAW